MINRIMDNQSRSRLGVEIAVMKLLTNAMNNPVDIVMVMCNSAFTLVIRLPASGFNRFTMQISFLYFFLV